MNKGGIIFKKLLMVYLMAILFLVVVPLGGLNTTLNNTSVICFRLDYVLHALMFFPLAVLWQMAFPDQRLWVVLTVAVFFAAVMEGVQYMLPYRAWNVNDLLANGVGIIVGGMLMGIINVVDRNRARKFSLEI